MKSQKLRRQRGVILTPQGLNKLQLAKHRAEELENFGSKYTLEELSERSKLAPFTVAKILAGEEGVDKQTLDRFFRTFDLELGTIEYCRPNPNFEEQKVAKNLKPRCYWGEAVDVSVFYGRVEELATLKQWLLQDNCRLVALLGMGGIGKTALAVKLAEQIQDQFEYLIWRSLRNTPAYEDFIAELVQFLSDQVTDLPETLDGRVSQLMEYLRKYRCLLVLDNAESILCSCVSVDALSAASRRLAPLKETRVGNYREGYEGYGEFLRRMGEERHQSCLVLTSREKPKEIALLEGKTLPIRSFPLTGLKEAEAQYILKARGFSGALIHCYAGNPLALKIVATTIQELFDGDVAEFLTQNTVVFGDIRELLDQQFERLSALEKQVMYWLAINREPLSYLELQDDLSKNVSKSKLLETLESLERRSLIGQNLAKFTQQPVVIEYVTEKLIEQLCKENTAEKAALIIGSAIVKAQAKGYVRETYIRSFLNSVINRINTTFVKKNIGNQQHNIFLKVKIF